VPKITKKTEVVTWGQLVDLAWNYPYA